MIKIRTVIDTFFQKKEETMLSDLLPAQAIQIGVECSDWKEAIKASAQYLIKKGAINEHYVDAMSKMSWKMVHILLLLQDLHFHMKH